MSNILIKYEVIDKSRAVIREYTVRTDGKGIWWVACDTDGKVTSDGHTYENSATLVATATARYWIDQYRIKTGESCALRTYRP